MLDWHSQRLPSGRGVLPSSTSHSANLLVLSAPAGAQRRERVIARLGASRPLSRLIIVPDGNSLAGVRLK